MQKQGPEKLFKYMKREHIDKFFADGTLRIGTLYEYRNVELHGPAVGDLDEGKDTKTLTSHQEETFDIRSNDPRAVFARQVIKGWDEFPEGTKLIIKMEPTSRLELYGSSPDVYTYCTSLEHSIELMKELGYESCLVIKNPYMFFQEINTQLKTISHRMFGAPIIYNSRTQPFDEPIKAHPAFIKPHEYSYQTEFRCVWEPNSGEPITPLFINCPSAKEFCERQDLKI